jgi:hypothetical protein
MCERVGTQKEHVMHELEELYSERMETTRKHRENEHLALLAIAKAAQDVYDNRVLLGTRTHDLLWRALGDALASLPKEKT